MNSNIANATYRVPAQQRRCKISRQEMLRRKRAIRGKKRTARYDIPGSRYDFAFRRRSGKELPLSENGMKKALDQGKLIVCSMRPGDFTTSGHYILLYSYDDTGFCVRDLNRADNSSRTWDYSALSSQIKNLWSISPTDF